MGPPTIKRRRMGELEPWVEKLIQDYGKNDSEFKTVKAHVVGVCDLTESQRTEHTDTCMMFLSDGSALIPAVLSGAAWEHLLKMSDIDSFSGLINAVIYVRDFKLEFHMNPDLASCQFYLNVYQIHTTCVSFKSHHPPSCTSLPSVREQIEKTWRSLRESSANSLSSASGVSLSSLLGAWHSDIIVNILNDAMEKITMSATHCPSVTPTHWHRERLNWKVQEQFAVPVPFLLIPEEQRELMTADPSADCESPGVVAPPLEESYQASSSTPNQTLAAEDLNDSGPNEMQFTPDHTRPEVLCGTGEFTGDEESPWDMFTPAPDLLDTHSQPESQSLLKETTTPLPLATSTQSLISKPISDVVSEDAITLAQRPQLTQISPPHLSGKSDRDPSEENERENPSSPPSWIVQNTAPPSKCTSILAPPTNPNSSSPPTKTKNVSVHSNGKAFSYLYHPDPQVATALSRLQIPGQLIQWAVRYLGTSDSADINAGADS
ncbi:adrenocortical dysplasia protein homolog isoform X1 [Paramisgurnus dabryanus]|uniref:adrenocortical dysplasia protein homolog isoform X1 n=1 Tax=Paramisgurnus dabryanus TaxID=90735 RepID=UPI0031F46046